MESFTYMSDGGIFAMIRNQRNNDDPFTFSLNVREFNLFRQALDIVVVEHPNDDLRNWAEYFTNSIASPEFILGQESFENMVYSLRYAWFNHEATEVGTWAGEFISTMAEALDVEFV